MKVRHQYFATNIKFSVKKLMERNLITVIIPPILNIVHNAHCLEAQKFFLDWTKLQEFLRHFRQEFRTIFKAVRFPPDARRNVSGGAMTAHLLGLGEPLLLLMLLL
jgi:hypothetical protein